MNHDDKKNLPSSKLFTADGKPLRVLSTSLGAALLANAILSTGVSATSGTAGGEEPKLVSWSSEEVKAYFDKNVDWSLPLPAAVEGKEVTAGGTSGSSTVVHHYNSGFGWDDLLLYHLLFNSGSGYSSSSYYKKRPTYYTSSKAPYAPKSYSSESFQNKQVAGSTVRPKTSSSTGSVTRRSTSSKPGGIGGKSSGLSSSGSSGGKSSSVTSGSSGKSGGFGG